MGKCDSFKKGTKAYKACMLEAAKKEKHSVKTSSTTTSNNTTTRRSRNTEVTNIESPTNRRTQTVSNSSSSNPAGSKARLTTKKNPNGNGRVILGDDGQWNSFGSRKGKKIVKTFQKVFNKRRG